MWSVGIQATRNQQEKNKYTERDDSTHEEEETEIPTQHEPKERKNPRAFP